jgi:hypothetical protein
MHAILQSECSSSTCSSRGAGLKPRTYFFGHQLSVALRRRLVSAYAAAIGSKPWMSDRVDTQIGHVLLR